MVALPRRSSPQPTESVVQAEIRKALGSLPYVRLWRNNVGELRDSSGRKVRYGLCVGSSDLIGIVAPSGRMIAIECKAPGWVAAKSGAAFEREENQRAFHRVVESFGGAAGFARSICEAMEIVERASK